MVFAASSRTIYLLAAGVAALLIFQAAWMWWMFRQGANSVIESKRLTTVRNVSIVMTIVAALALVYFVFMSWQSGSSSFEGFF